MLPMCHFRMALKAALQNTRPGPYTKLAPLHIHVLMVTEQPRVLIWDFRDNSAVAKTTKKNTVAAITDGVSVTKLTLFEEFSSKVVEGRNYRMQNYTIRGESQSYILVTKETNFFRCGPVVCVGTGLWRRRKPSSVPRLHTQTLRMWGGARDSSLSREQLSRYVDLNIIWSEKHNYTYTDVLSNCCFYSFIILL